MPQEEDVMDEEEEEKRGTWVVLSHQKERKREGKEETAGGKGNEKGVQKRGEKGRKVRGGSEKTISLRKGGGGETEMSERRKSKMAVNDGTQFSNFSKSV